MGLSGWQVSSHNFCCKEPLWIVRLSRQYKHYIGSLHADLGVHSRRANTTPISELTAERCHTPRLINEGLTRHIRIWSNDDRSRRAAGQEPKSRPFVFQAIGTVSPDCSFSHFRYGTLNHGGADGIS